MQQKEAVKGKGPLGRLFVAILAMAVAFLWIALPVAANAARMQAEVSLDDGKVMKITYNQNGNNIAPGNIHATVDNVTVYPQSGHADYPIIFTGHTRAISESLPGPIIVFFGDSTCILVGSRWIGYPAGTTCP